MSDQGPIGLADFLADLRSEIANAQSRAERDSLKLGIEEISPTLEVGYTIVKDAEANAALKVKFWVFEIGEAGIKGSASSERVRTQTLSLTMRPRVEHTIVTENGTQTTIVKGVDVEGAMAESEERPPIPRAEP